MSAIAALMLVVAVVEPVAAREPTYGTKKYASDWIIGYYWDSGALAPTTWLKTATDLAAGTDWPTGDNVNANTPKFQKDNLDYTGVVQYGTQTESQCDVGFQWDSCTDYYNTTGTSDKNGRWKRTVFDQASVWCQSQGQNEPWSGTCRDVRRVWMHEWGHAVGLSRRLDPPVSDKHSPESESYTVMRLLTPTNGNTGYHTHSLQECDVIRLQLLYDTNAASSAFPACVDEIPGQLNPNGLYTSTQVTSGTAYSACLGQGVSVSGTLRLKSTSYYGAISGNTLSTRLLHFDRKLPSSSTWTTQVTSTTTTTSSTNWSRTFSSSSAVTYQYRAQFYQGTEATLDSSTSGVFTITWSTAC